jgi:hypothetical protein
MAVYFIELFLSNIWTTDLNNCYLRIVKIFPKTFFGCTLGEFEQSSATHKNHFIVH